MYKIQNNQAERHDDISTSKIFKKWCKKDERGIIYWYNKKILKKINKETVKIATNFKTAPVMGITWGNVTNQ